ncbi:MAG: MerC mercury resistance protein [Sphingomonas bacterium]|uniref:MerC domain-containing protein n=1 Tax=Sphingomonas bacterium TaxID=1895847 RepID=UPI0026123760|nr:MerC domain-containing protein [Sphingomonas bacterium]MDB5705681.1 MerC mercury resistance protein [Sphingomonas bacterium]
MEILPILPAGKAGSAARARADWIERAALGASLLCLVHCLALPLLIAALPMLSRLLSLPESVHVWLLAFAVPASGLALVSGRMRHGAVYPLVVGATGLALLAVGALVVATTPAETWVTVAGSLSLAFAHGANWRLRHALHAHG